MIHYYIIAGLDNGYPITPYVINSEDNDLDWHLEVHGDSSRYYKEITWDQVLDYIKAREDFAAVEEELLGEIADTICKEMK